MDDDVIGMLKNLDRRLHLVELHVNRQQRKPAKGQRPRGRPKGSRSVPLPVLAPVLFEEHDTNVTARYTVSEGDMKTALAAAASPGERARS